MYTCYFYGLDRDNKRIIALRAEDVSQKELNTNILGKEQEMVTEALTSQGQAKLAAQVHRCLLTITKQ